MTIWEKIFNNINLPILLPALIAVFSWFVGHWLASLRDQKNKCKELRIKYLLEAYRLLESVGNRKFNKENAKKMESAIADIQLLGSQKQITLAQDVAKEISTTKKAELLEILQDLRKDLRKELNLTPAKDELKFLRANFDK